MAVGGTVSKPIFVKDGQYLSLVADAAITLGNVVEYTATGTDTCTVGTVADGATSYAGVAVSGDRYSRTATDNTIAAGSKVTVCTRGVVYVYTGTSTILRGSFVEAGAAGVVELLTTNGTAHYPEDILGIALDGNSGAAATIRIKLIGR